MPEVYVGPLDRFDISLTNALQGNVSGAGRALFAPDTLAPVERQRAAERFFGQTEPGPLKELLSLTTNPTVVLGGILALKYPVNPSRMYLEQDAQFKGGLRRLVPIYDHIADFNEIYRGTAVPSLMGDLGGRMHSFHKQGNDRLGQATQAYLDITGSLPTAEVESKAVYEMMRRSGDLGEMLENHAARLEMAGRTDLAGRIRKFSEAAPAADIGPGGEKLIEGWKSYLDWAYETKGVENVEGLAETIDRKLHGKGKIGAYREGYFPAVTKYTAFESKAVEESFAREIITGGKKVSGLRIQGPHQTLLSASQLAEALADYTQDTRGAIAHGTPEFWDGFQAYLERSLPTGVSAKVASGHNLARFNRTIPEIEGLRKAGMEPLADLLEESKTVYENWAANQSFTGGKGPPLGIKQARLDGTPTLGVYNQQAARDYAWSVKPDGWDRTIGQRINESLQELATGIRRDPQTGEAVLRATSRVRVAPVAGTFVGAEPIRASMLRETFIPAALGTSTHDEMLQAAWWDSSRVAAADLLDPSKPTGQLGRLMENSGLGGVRKKMYLAIAESPKAEYKQAMASVSSLFYQSTLALPNILAPVKNLFQTFSTTVPRIGWKHTVNGVKTTFAGMQDYLDLRYAKNLTHEEAFVKAFPGFRETGLAMEEGLLKAMSQVYDSSGATTGVAGAYDKFKRMSMSLFTGTEMFNRLNAYNGGTSFLHEAVVKAAKAGEQVFDYGLGKHVTLPTDMKELVASRVYKEVVHAGAGAVLADTQFGGGVLGTPVILSKLPAPLRQLANFPVRFASMMTHASGMEGFLGQAGRAMVVAGITGGVFATLLGDAGKKLANDATFFGSFPAPSEMGPFAPIPLVPPILQLGGAAAQAAVTGDATNLKRSLPLLVPGGVGLSKAAPLLGNRTISEFLEKPYVDYDAITPDGRYPMHNQDGSLIGYYNANQLFAKSIGIGDINTLQEQSIEKWAKGFGPRITGLRSKYLEARMSNDQREADRIDAEYQRLNPGMGSITGTIKNSHIESLASRRDASRLERMLEAQPADVRAQLSAISAVAFAQSGPKFLGIDPNVLTSTSTIKERTPYRLQPPRQRPIMPSEETTTMSLGENY